MEKRVAPWGMGRATRAMRAGRMGGAMPSMTPQVYPMRGAGAAKRRGRRKMNGRVAAKRRS